MGVVAEAPTAQAVVTSAVRVEVRGWWWVVTIPGVGRLTGIGGQKEAILAALDQAKSLGLKNVTLDLPKDCGLRDEMGKPGEYWRDVVQMMDEVGARLPFQIGDEVEIHL